MLHRQIWLSQQGLTEFLFIRRAYDRDKVSEIQDYSLVRVVPVRVALLGMPRGGMALSDAFALVIAKHRTAKRLSREALAAKAHLHQTYIGLIERGLRNPSLDAADAIAQGLGFPLWKLLSEAEAVRRKAAKPA